LTHELTKFRNLDFKLARNNLVGLGYKGSDVMEFDIWDSQNYGLLGCDDVQFGGEAPNCHAATARDFVCLGAIQLVSVHSDLRPSTLVQPVTLLPCMRTIFAASFDLEIGYTEYSHGFLQSLQVNDG
jgi:hypothetical protein